MQLPRRAFLASLALAAIPTLHTAQTAPDAQVYVIHGIPGQDLGLDPALAVDVSVNGACTLQNFTFGRIAGPVSLPAGTYEIDIALADDGLGCTEAPVISAAVPIAAGEVVTIIAHLDANGAPTASKFTNDLTPLGLLQTRVQLHHTAAAPAVDVSLRRTPLFGGPVANTKVAGVLNGQQGILDELFGLYRVAVLLAGTETIALGPAEGVLLPGQATSVFVVGSAATGSLTVIVQRLPVDPS